MKILWTDDEIDLLKPHIIYLEKKGYSVSTCSNGVDALEMVEQETYDVAFLDEHMPGLSGLQTLAKLKEIRPDLPVVMVTKSEEENIMEEAIGSRIADYLIKPVKPTQILLSLKKILDRKQLVSDKTSVDYRQAFTEIGQRIYEPLTAKEWGSVYRKMVQWEIDLASIDNDALEDILKSQFDDANIQFTRFVFENYEQWLTVPQDDTPLLSHHMFRKKIFPMLDKGKKVFFLMVDNLRFDQWAIFRTMLQPYFSILKEEVSYSILPTTTMYSRNAIFSGMLPAQIEKQLPDLWVQEKDEHSKNRNEEELLLHLMKKHGRKESLSYTKSYDGNEEVDHLFSKITNSDLSVFVVNFIDLLSHARTDTEMLRQLSADEAAYRSLAKSWFEHSTLFALLKRLSKEKISLVLSSDHGSIRLKQGIKIRGERDLNVNLRYKLGANLGYKKKEVFAFDPDKIGLPKHHFASECIFPRSTKFFAYANNYNHFAKMYTDTFQHGGISMEEMMTPFVLMEGK